MSNAQRAALAAAALAVLVIGFAIASSSGGSDDKATRQIPTTATTGRSNGAANGSAKPRTPTTTAPARPPAGARIAVRGGRPVGGIETITVHKGDAVRFVVSSDVAEEVHVHGYDLHGDVHAGGKVRFSFKASIEGIFEVELEQRSEQIAKLVVRP
jgi:plastocyanin